MNQYLIDTMFAAKELIKLIGSGEKQYVELEMNYEQRKKYHQTLYDDFKRKEFDPEDHFNEHQMMFAFSKQAEFQQNVLKPILSEMDRLRKSMNHKRHSIDALSGSLLQIAKQGISLTYQGLHNCPSGRTIKNETLKNIIWQGRNQTMHYEEGNYRRPLIDCFNNLGYGSIPMMNLGKEIIDMLGWTSYKQYENDMNSLLK
jgi:hypothetical protein